MIETRIDELLAERGRTFYWLAKETGISHTTLWRLKKGKALGINFGTLEGICLALACQPGDVLKLSGGGEMKKRGTGKSPAAGRGASQAPRTTEIQRRPRGRAGERRRAATSERR
jgi:putative transcriptional regulator